MDSPRSPISYLTILFCICSRKLRFPMQSCVSPSLEEMTSDYFLKQLPDKKDTQFFINMKIFSLNRWYGFQSIEFQIAFVIIKWRKLQACTLGIQSLCGISKRIKEKGEIKRRLRADLWTIPQRKNIQTQILRLTFSLETTKYMHISSQPFEQLTIILKSKVNFRD